MILNLRYDLFCRGAHFVHRFHDFENLAPKLQKFVRLLSGTG